MEEDGPAASGHRALSAAQHIPPPSPPPASPPPPPPPSAAPAPRDAAAPVAHDWVLVDDDDEELPVQLAMEEVDQRSEEPARLPAPSSPAAVSAQPSASSSSPTLLDRSPDRVIEVVDVSDSEEPEDGDSARERSAKRRRVCTPIADGVRSIPAPLPAQAHHRSPQQPRAPRPSSPAESAAAPSSPPRSPGLLPIAVDGGRFLSFDVDAFLAGLPSVPPAMSPPSWTAPPPPYTAVEYTDSLPTFDVGPSSSRFPRRPRPGAQDLSRDVSHAAAAIG